MKIGILSMQRVINYGSFLQSYALKSLIESLGHEVNFVDIKPGKQVMTISRVKSDNKPKIDKYIFKRIEHIWFSKKRRKNFESVYFEETGINQPCPENECDMIVIGSDEVFNCCQSSKWGFSDQLFGNTDVTSITYAASCGYTTYEKVAELGLSEKIWASLTKLQAISVRDKNTKAFVQSVLSVEPEQHLDPVLIYDWKNEVPQTRRYGNYILIYAYDNRIYDESEINAIKKFAKKHHLELISFGVYQRWCDRNVSCSPFELLSYFDGAKYVITDTFHGTVISIKRNKPFAVLIRESNKEKLTDLLERFGLTDRELMSINALEDVITKDIDYSHINEKIRIAQSEALDYLKTNLSRT